MTTPPRLLGTYKTPTFSYGDVRITGVSYTRSVGLSDGYNEGGKKLTVMDWGAG